MVSHVLSHFRRDTARKSATCNNCGDVIKTGGGSTSGLNAHLRKHPDIVAQKEAESDSIRPRSKQSKINNLFLLLFAHCLYICVENF